jgi:hypothetical protein
LLEKRDSHDEEYAIPVLRHIAKLQVAVLMAAFVLVFLSVTASPMYASFWSGAVGGRSVWFLSLLMAMFAAQHCWLRGSRFYPGNLADESHRARAAARWGRFGLLCIFLLFANRLAFDMCHAPHWGMVAGDEQPQYYAYLHSWVFDHDLDFSNEYASIPGASEALARAHPGDPGFNGAGIGTALIWLPSYLAGHGAVHLLRQSGAGLAPDGLSSPYAAAVAFGGLCAVWAGMVMVFATLRRHVSARAAFLATALIWMASPLVWYLTDQPWMPHGASFFAMALVLWLWDRDRGGRSRWGWAALGSAIGLATLVRSSHVVLLVLPLLDVVHREPDPEKTPSSSVTGLLLCLAGVAVVFILQVLAWWRISGLDALPIPAMAWTRPAILPLLFSAHHGLLAWHPVLILGFLGIALLWRRARHLALGLALVVAAEVYVNAAMADWPAGTSFGMRRLVGVLPFLAPGIAVIGSWAVGVARKRPAIPAACFVLLLFLYNDTLTRQLRYGWIPRDDAVSFERVWSSSASLLHERFGNPSSYPMNLWFAHKHGVPPSQYDKLSGPRPITAKMEVERASMRPYLGRGWYLDHYNFGLADGTAVAGSTDCELLLPLEGGKAYSVLLRMSTAKAFQSEQRVAFSLNGHDLGTAALAPGNVRLVSLKVPAEVTRNGVNVLAFTFDFSKISDYDYSDKGLDVPTRPSTKFAARLWRLVVEPESATPPAPEPPKEE